MTTLVHAVRALAVLGTVMQGPSPDALYADRANLASAHAAANAWAAELAQRPSAFEAAWKLARADYWLGGHAPTSQRRTFLTRGIEAGRQAIAAAPNQPEGHFWTAANMGALAEVSGIRDGLKYRRADQGRARMGPAGRSRVPAGLGRSRPGPVVFQSTGAPWRQQGAGGSAFARFARVTTRAARLPISFSPNCCSMTGAWPTPGPSCSRCSTPRSIPSGRQKIGSSKSKPRHCSTEPQGDEDERPAALDAGFVRAHAAVAIRMPNGALASLAGNVDPHHRVAIADLILARREVRGTVQRLVRELQPDVVGLSVMTFQRGTALKIAKFVRRLAP